VYAWQTVAVLGGEVRGAIAPSNLEVSPIAFPPPKKTKVLHAQNCKAIAK